MKQTKIKPKPKPRLSQKVKQAAYHLGDEDISDLGQAHLLEQVKKKKITAKQLYKAMRHFGYRWQDSRWIKTNPRWLENLINQDGEWITSG